MTPEWPENRREAVCAWLTANGINPRDVPQDADITIDQAATGRFLRCEVFDRGPDGHIKVDERGKKPAILVINVPLQVEPPDWWEPHVKPTRDQLLAVLKQVQDLADEEGEMNHYIARARLRAVLSLAYEREGLAP